MKRNLLIGFVLLIVLVSFLIFYYATNYQKASLYSSDQDSNTSIIQEQNQQIEKVESCKSKINCTSITNLMVPYHGCSTNNGCRFDNRKCVSICEGKDKEECLSTTLFSYNPNSSLKGYVSDENICEWRE